MSARDGSHWPRRVWGVRVEEIHPGLLQWHIAGVCWRWHFWGGAVNRAGKPLANFTGSPNKVIAWSMGYEEGHRDAREGCSYGEET